MNKVLDFLKEHKYLMVALVLVGISITLGVTYSNYIVTSNNHKAAEMYIGELKYSIEINGSTTNTLSVPTGETIIDVKVNNQNPVDTYYKLLYLKNSNLTVEYFGLASELDNSNNVTKSYDKPNDSVTSSNTKTIKLQITNNSTSSQTLGLSVKGGYITNTLNDIVVPSTYSEITLSDTSTNTYFCTTTDTLTQGLKYVNGQYTYGYKQHGHVIQNNPFVLFWTNMDTDGWGVMLTNRASTGAVNSEVCTYIDNKPVVDMSYMFFMSRVTILDLSSFNTSKVTDMSSMFSGSQATTLDVSHFDTSNVTDMSFMFSGSIAKTINLSSFNTSKVTDMSSMFSSSQATTLNVSHFDTSNVTDMSLMFSSSQAVTLDLSSFNTSNVTNMYSMFSNSNATTIDLSNFDTSKVTDMSSMFSGSQATALDVSNFDTSKVTNMSSMFSSSENLKTIYVSNKFNTNNVTSSTRMFGDCINLVGGAGTKYNSSYVDKAYARIDGGTSNPGYFTDIADKPKEPESFATDSWKTIIKAVKDNNISKYHVGDTRTIDMGTYGTHTLRIANTSTPSECSRTGFSQTACGFVLEFADIITTHTMNDTNTNVGGWPVTSMRKFVNNDIYNALPSEIKNAIIDTTVVSGHGSTSGETNFTSTDKLYLLSTAEVWSQGSSNTISGVTAEDLTRQLDYYKNLGTSTSNYSGAIKKNGTSASTWWLRAARSYGTNFFLSVYTNGDWRNYYANSTHGVAPAFRLG